MNALGEVLASDRSVLPAVAWKAPPAADWTRAVLLLEPAGPAPGREPHPARSTAGNKANTAHRPTTANRTAFITGAFLKGVGELLSSIDRGLFCCQIIRRMGYSTIDCFDTHLLEGDRREVVPPHLGAMPISAMQPDRACPETLVRRPSEAVEPAKTGRTTASEGRRTGDSL